MIEGVRSDRESIAEHDEDEIELLEMPRSFCGKAKCSHRLG